MKTQLEEIYALSCEIDCEFNALADSDNLTSEEQARVEALALEIRKNAARINTLLGA